jgi:hypothetical protein
MKTSFYQRTAMAAAIAACFPGAAMAAGAARVDFATGNVSAVGADGRSRALSRGSEVQVGETVSTQQGRAQLRFADGAYMSLQPQTELKVEEFRYSGKPDGNENIVMNLIKGGMRTITGLIGRTNRNAYRLRTDVATIGIRGTEYSVRYTNSIELFCADGAVSVENQSGSFTVTGGTGVMVSNQQSAPQQTDQKPVLPPESPVQKEEEQLTEKPAEPVNAIQEAQAGGTAGSSPLTGTLSLNMAFSNYDTCQDGCYGTVHYFGVTGTLDASGLVSFDDNGGFTTSGTSSVQSSGNDGIVAWGRWNGGTTGGDGELSNVNLSGTPLHYVVGLPATNLPASGSGTYNMIGATAPSVGGVVTSASVQNSSISVDFASSSATYRLDMLVNGVAMGTGPGGMPISRSGASLSGGGSIPINAVFSCGASLQVQGFLAGDGAVRAGMGYFIDANFTSGHVAGAIAYTKN